MTVLTPIHSPLHMDADAVVVVVVGASPLELRRDESLRLLKEREQEQSQPHEAQRLAPYDAVPGLQLEDEDSSVSSAESCHSSSSNDDNGIPYKSVRFSIQPTIVIDHIHRLDMTEEERLKTWMTFEDRIRIMDDIRRIKTLMAATGGEPLSLSSTETTTRGLEPRNKKFLRHCRLVVMQEQERQWKHFTDHSNNNFSVMIDDFELNDVMISTKYALVNQRASFLARERAKKDYMEVVEMRQEDDDADIFYDSNAELTWFDM